jgi:hypothetical protein
MFVAQLWQGQQKTHPNVTWQKSQDLPVQSFKCDGHLNIAIFGEVQECVTI